MFYILNFKTHDFISCNSAKNVVVSIGNLLEQGAYQNDLEIINGLGEEVRFTVDEFSDYCKTLSLVDQADLDMVSFALEKEGDLRGYRSADADIPKYPHDFGNGYRIQTFYANLLPNVYVNEVGDIYDVKEDAEAEYPDADIVIGFRVVCDIPGRDPFPEGCKPFCKTVEEAIADYEKHILPELTINDSLVYDHMLTNTQINYLYRDADNYKVFNQSIVSGVLSKEQQELILTCLDEGVYFIPGLVGLPEVKFDEVDNPEVDHQWFELYEEDFVATTRKPTVSVTANELVNAFRKCKDKWMDIYLGTEEVGASVKKVIRGMECECFEYSDPMYGSSGKMRMQLEGAFGENINREAMILVPMSLLEGELEIIADLWLTEQERELGLPLGVSCTSSGWWVGSADPSKDARITDEYDFLLPIALANQEAQERLQHEIDAFYREQGKVEQMLNLEYKEGETDWAAQLEVKSEDLERLITDKEELLEQSRLLSVGSMVTYNGYYCEVDHIENNAVYLLVNGSDLHFEVHVSKFLDNAQLVPEKSREKQASLTEQIWGAVRRADVGDFKRGEKEKPMESER